MTAWLPPWEGERVRISPERQTWANSVLPSPATADDVRVINLLTNVTLSGRLDQAPDGSSTPDNDLEYVLAAEIL